MIVVSPCCFKNRRTLAPCLSIGHKITSLRMVVANFEPSDQINKGTALPMPHVAGEVWMKLGAIKFLMFFLVDNEVLKARRKLEGSLDAIEFWGEWFR